MNALKLKEDVALKDSTAASNGGDRDADLLAVELNQLSISRSGSRGQGSTAAAAASVAASAKGQHPTVVGLFQEGAESSKSRGAEDWPPVRSLKSGSVRSAVAGGVPAYAPSASSPIYKTFASLPPYELSADDRLAIELEPLMEQSVYL